MNRIDQIHPSHQMGHQVILILSALFIISSVFASVASASTSPRTQEIRGYLDLDEFHPFVIPNLRKGETLYLYLEQVAGSLDPILMLIEGDRDAAVLATEFGEALLSDLKSDKDFLVVFPPFADRSVIAWDDNSGEGADAMLKFIVPRNGDYKAVVAGAYNMSIERQNYATFGRYRFLIGVNAPEVGAGKVSPPHEPMARETRDFRNRIEKTTVTLKEEEDSVRVLLVGFESGDTLYLRMDALKGNRHPSIKLRDDSNQLLAFDNISGSAASSGLQYKFPKEERNAWLEIYGILKESETPTETTFQLLAAVNEPKVLEGQGESFGRSIIKQPTPVKTGIRLDQITSINQKNKNFGVVGTILLEWMDPGLAFSPARCRCSSKKLSLSSFKDLIAEKGLRWPHFIISNQQGRRTSQELLIRIQPSGLATYAERFSATLQVPDFDFRHFPFDQQRFYMKISGIEAKEYFIFEPYPEYSGLGTSLGEEQWYFLHWNTQAGTETTLRTHSTFNFQIIAGRHLSYYVFRIFIPLFLIITLSWAVFFLKDYAKRIDLSSGNILVFVAFNFTIGSDLPRLGYVTFIDTFLALAFFITALTVIANVVLRRFELADKKELAKRIDRFFIWIYPLLYGVGLFGLKIFLSFK